MKSFVAIGILMMALSLCNLMGRRNPHNSDNNTNSNGNTSGPETTSAENSNASAAKKPTPVLPWAGVLNGKAIKLVQPPYPPIAKTVHASGEVRVQVVVDEEGNVILAAPESGHPLLLAAAVVAARQSKFTPTKLAGQPVKVRGEVVYNFVAQ